MQFLGMKQARAKGYDWKVSPKGYKVTRYGLLVCKGRTVTSDKDWRYFNEVQVLVAINKNYHGQG